MDVEGSYDLTFRTVDASFDTSSGPPLPGDGSPPSLTTPARLDVRKAAAGGYEAVFTARWGSPARYAVAVSAEALLLTGKGSVTADTSAFSGASDTWETLRLARAADGRLTGAVQGEGSEIVGQGDVVWLGTLAGAGRIVKDATKPEMRATITSPHGPADALLPWDPIVIQTAEPVTPSGVEEQTQIGGDHGDSLAIRWEPRKDGGDWPGVTSYAGHVDDWTRAVSGEPWRLFNGGDLVRDLVGLSVQDWLDKKLAFLPLGASTDAVGFDSDITYGAPWGPTQILGGGIAGTDDERCEGGGCMRIGPVELTACGLDRAGFAGRLTRKPQGHVELRYRILAKPKYESGPSAPYLYSDAVTLELAAPRATTIHQGVRATDASLVKLDASVDEMTFGTPWATLDVAAPGAGEIGFAVYAGGPSVVGGGCGGPPPPPTEIEILVESVSSK